MATSFIDRLKRGLSAVRFEAYRAQAGEADADVLARYVWNVALAEALLPTMHCLEVAFRNAIHREAMRHAGTPHWLDPTDAACLLGQREQRKVHAARRELRRHNTAVTPDRLVAELTFGFWTSLLSRDYERPLIVPIIADAFPGLPTSQRTRTSLARRFNGIRKFRNRVAHHEPVWNNPYLQQNHQGLLQAIGWMSVEVQQTAMVIDRFPQVHRLGAAFYATKLTPLVLTP